VERGDAATGAKSGAPFPVNSRVNHKQWGSGQVLRYEADEIIVLFERVGYKTLSVPVVLEQGLLTEGRAGEPENAADPARSRK
jgi:ATP-dependent DNA helicase RecQ